MDESNIGVSTVALLQIRPTSPFALSSLTSQSFSCSSESEPSLTTSSSVATSISSGASCRDLESVEESVVATDDTATAMVMAPLSVSAKAPVAGLTHLGRSRHRSKSSIGSKRDNRRGRSHFSSGSMSESVDQRNLDADDLKKMSRDELIKCLEWERDDRNKLKLRVEELTSNQDASHVSTERLQSITNAHAQSEEEHEQERIRMEVQMTSKIAHIQKSNYQIARLKREKKELERKFTEEVKSFESERQELYDSQQALKARCHALASRHPSSESSSTHTTAHSSLSSTEHIISEDTQLEAAPKNQKSEEELELALDENLRTKIKMEALEVAYKSVQEILEESKEEIVNLKQTNAEYQQEIVAYEYLLMERTISGKMQDTQLLSQPYSEPPTISSQNSSSELPDGEPTPLRRSLDAVHEEDKQSVVGSALDPDFADRSLSFSDDQGAIDKGMLDPEFKVVIAEKSDNQEKGQSCARRETKSRLPLERKLDSVLFELGVKVEEEVQGEVLGNFAVTGSGLDLAAELGRAEAGEEEGNLRNLGKGDDGEALLAELRNLRDANKALTLYCSKILDRILAIDGFEDVLSADNGKSLQGSVRRLIGTAQQKSVKARPSLQNASLKPASEPVIGRVSLLSSIDTSFPIPAIRPSKKKSRASVDWRSFTSFFSPSSPSSTMFSSPVDTPSDEKSNLCGIPATSRSIEMSDPLSSRKLSREEEREEDEDRVQRQRISLIQRQLQNAEFKPSALSASSASKEIDGASSPGDVVSITRRHSQEIVSNAPETWDDSANSSDLSFKSCGEPGCLGVGNCESGHVCGGADFLSESVKSS